MADLRKTEYPTMLATMQPSQAVAVLHDRVRTINKVNTDIADWLEERKHVEEQYAAALRRLSRKHPHDSSADLGVFTSPWQKIVESTELLAESHQLLALKIETDVEKPLRDYATSNADLKAMPTIQGRLASMVRDLDAAHKNADKMKSKSTRVDGAAHEEQEALAQWDSQAPYVFEKLQIVDESRLNHLRDVLTQFQTHEVDQVERNRVTAEQCLNSLLNVETEDEIARFALMHAEGRAPPAHDTRRTSRVPSAAVGSSFVPPAAFRNDDANQRSESVNEDDKKKKRFGGFKRLGTVIGRGRDKDKDKPSSPAPTPPAKRGSTSRFGSGFNINSDRETSATPTRPGQNMRAPSSGLLSVLDTSRQDEIPVERSIAPLATTMASRLARGESADAISPVNGDQPSNFRMNGISSSRPPQLQEPLQPSAPMTMIQEPLRPNFPSAIDEETPEPEAPLQPINVVRDYMGYQAPASSVDPITQAEREASSYNEQSGQPYKLDIRNAPIAEEGADANTAMASLANTLRAQAAAPKRSNTNRGRRDVRNTIFMPSPPVQEATTNEQYPFPSGAPSMPIMSPTIAALQGSQSMYRPGTGDDSTMSDNVSVRSAQSGNSLGPQVRHPEMTQSGLNSSIVETVSAWFEQGQLTKAVVIGELALAFNQGAFPSGSRTESIRLENFQILEKVAPNPSFIEQNSSRPGEYTVDVSNISRMAVAFKYQVHLDGMDSTSQAPLIIKPAWKVESKQTSVILSYSLNPAFSVQHAVTFSNLTLIIHLEGARATGCQSKPTGDFSREKGLILWKLDDVTLRPGEQPQKLLARFATESEARPGRVEAKWDLVGGSGSGLGVSHLESSSGFDASDPFADESSTSAGGSWRELKTARRLISGTYTAT